MSQKNLDGSASAAVYSQEQLALVRKVQNSKNYYEVLNVARKANEMEIKKAYKQLAFQLHPDKNLAPGADEAFKKLGNAVEVLLNKDKRKEYNDNIDCIDFDDPNDPDYNPASFLQSERYQEIMRHKDSSLLHGPWWIPLLNASGPVYSLKEATNYPVRRETQNLGVPYYVNNNFAGNFNGLLSRLENIIEVNYLKTRRYGRQPHFCN